MAQKRKERIWRPYKGRMRKIISQNFAIKENKTEVLPRGENGAGENIFIWEK
jgi:hypothetical protein